VGRTDPGKLERSDLERAADDMAAFGFRPDEVARMRGLAEKAGDDVFLVHPHNVLAVKLFAAMQTQWRMASLSTWSSAQLVPTGLDYSAISHIAAGNGLALVGDYFPRLQVMEAEALAAFAEKRKRQ
jgi:hypothetical protein